MTDNEFEKVVEQCRKNESCIGCPLEHLDYSSECVSAIIEYCYDKINRQNAEIERLQKENNNFADIGKMYSEIKAEAVKEFADRCKKKASMYGFGDKSGVWVNTNDIDNLLKEIGGEK